MTLEQFDASKMYTRYAVTIKMRGRLVGGIPETEELIASHIRARTGHDDEQTKAQIAEVLAARKRATTPEAAAQADADHEALTDEKVKEATAEHSNGFLADEVGLYIHARNVKAMLRESWDLAQISKKQRGAKQIQQHGFEVKAPGGKHERIYFDRKAPDGHEEKPIHVMTAQGPRDSLKRNDYVIGVTIRFEVWIYKVNANETRHVSEEMLVLMLTHAQENGLGADRSQLHGKFDVIEFGKIGE